MQSHQAIGAMEAAQQPTMNGNHPKQRISQTSNANRTEIEKVSF